MFPGTSGCPATPRFAEKALEDPCEKSPDTVKNAYPPVENKKIYPILAIERTDMPNRCRQTTAAC